jgi:hypothetical protein
MPESLRASRFRHGTGILAQARAVFDAAELWNPMHIAGAEVDWSLLEALPFLTVEEKISLEKEYPYYKAVAPSFGNDGDVLHFFYSYKDSIPCWFATSKLIVLLLPSSASAERVFSMYKAMFDKDGVSLQETREAKLMIRYNRQQRQQYEKKPNLGPAAGPPDAHGPLPPAPGNAVEEQAVHSIIDLSED